MAGWRGSRSRLGGRGSGIGPGGDGSALMERLASNRTVRLGKVQPQAPGHRTVFCNDREANALAKFKGNSVSTTKYDVFTFLPKGLFEQFRRVANLYFLMISILSCTPVSPVSPITNVLPLSLVLLVSLIKEAWEDWKRFQNDMTINNTPVDILQDQKWVSVPWKKLQVGDIIRVRQDGYFPADLLFLASTNPDGVCYTETANLDGETNLKIRKALEKTWDYVTSEKVTEFKGEVQCEQPNNSLYTFTGNLIVQKQTLPLSPNQILLRGCSLRNTEYIVGAVIFTGHETKVMMNTMKIPSKRSTLEKKLDKLILTLFCVLFCMCLLGAIGSGVFINRKYYYLHLENNEHLDAQFNPDNRFAVAALTMFTLITLYSPIIPISLYVSVEMIKFVQSTQFINNDLRMYHSESNTPALARTSNLNEELGQVEYIFSDKTGTLTRNLMEFFKCSIGGEIYGTGVSEIEIGTAQRNGMKVEVQKSSNAEHEKGFNFDDSRLMRGSWRSEPNPDICKEFFRCLAICHTVLPEGEESPEKICYQAASPDEAALVTAAKNFGFFFYKRTPTMIYVRESPSPFFSLSLSLCVCCGELTLFSHFQSLFIPFSRIFAYTIRLFFLHRHIYKGARSARITDKFLLIHSPFELIKKPKKKKDFFFFGIEHKKIEKMVNFHLGLFVLCSVLVLVSGSSRNLPILSFDEGYSQLFGDDNLMVLKDGKSVHISLNERTGSGFVSQDLYLHGFFSASVKLPADYTAGVVVAFYMSNGDIFEKNHDEIDFEFLGNIRGKDWRIQTNVYGNGSTSIGREERYGLWFDPSEDFHQYSILWTKNQIIFYVDNVPIREIKRTEAMGGDFPSKPMSLYATIWDGSDWATNGGRYRVNYKYAPYTAKFSEFVLHGCAVEPIEQQTLKCDNDPKSYSVPTGITSEQRRKMENFRKKHMQYSYCYDRTRYRVPPAECVIDPKEAERLRVFDPVTFGGVRHRHGKRHHRSRSRSSQEGAATSF